MPTVPLPGLSDILTNASEVGHIDDCLGFVESNLLRTVRHMHPKLSSPVTALIS